MEVVASSQRQSDESGLCTAGEREREREGTEPRILTERMHIPVWCSGCQF